MTLVDIARLLLHVREAGQNQGLRVNAIQIYSGGQPGDSWCAELVWMCLDLYYHGKSPVDRFQSVEAFRQIAVANGWIVDDPQPGDLVISVNSAGIGHHIGIVTVISPLTSIAGNTSADGTSSNGDRVAEHGISPSNKIFVRFPS